MEDQILDLFESACKMALEQNEVKGIVMARGKVVAVHYIKEGDCTTIYLSGYVVTNSVPPNSPDTREDKFAGRMIKAFSLPHYLKHHQIVWVIGDILASVSHS